MSDAPFRLAPLDAAYDRTGFNSDSEPLNRYLREQVTQDIRCRLAACFMALLDGERIAGYYTLASASMLLADALDRAARFGDCCLSSDGGRQRQGGSGFLPSSRLYCLARLAVYPVFAASNRHCLR